MADKARGEKKTYVIGPVYSAVQRLVLRTGNNGTNETDGFFRQARRRPAAVWGIRQGAATTHGGKRRCFMFRYLRFVTLVSRGNRGRSPRSRSRKRLNSRSFRISANAATTSRYPYVAPFRVDAFDQYRLDLPTVHKARGQRGSPIGACAGRDSMISTGSGRLAKRTPWLTPRGQSQGLHTTVLPSE